MRSSSHDILFEPIRIGPVTAKNRFYQVPHCTGMGWKRPKTLAAMRGIKAEGGWGVVNTEYCSVHPSSDNEAFANATLWGAEDIRAHRLMTDAVHEHGALAGVELWLAGGTVANYATCIPALGLRNLPLSESGGLHPFQARQIDKQDIRDIRKWHRDAARRAIEAGFDIVYVYATHGYLLSEFLDAGTNTRADEYGGSLINRTRLVRELIEETLEAVAGKAAVACRFSVHLGDPERYDAFGLMADMPDLWDLTIPDYDIEMGVSRFVKEGALVDSVAKAKTLSTRPVVSVGRFTSPDTMAQVIRSGAQDLIGAARPSIADPFLPSKIKQGQFEDIRECIGCNICYAHDTLGVPIRCTQNPTMGEEWRLGWHPEKTGRSSAPKKVLVVGAGPAGLEAARVLGERGHQVMLAEAGRTLGGRVTREARMPGLSEWGRVRDWRVGQIGKLANVAVFPESRLQADDILALEVEHVLLATGAVWSVDGIGRHSNSGFETTDPAMIISAESILDGSGPDSGHVAVFDDDHYYLGSVMALSLRQKGCRVSLITPAGRAGEWGHYTSEIRQSNRALIDAGVDIVTNTLVRAVEHGRITLACVFSGRETHLACDAIVPLSRRIPVTGLYRALTDSPEKLQAAGIKSVRRIGDAEAPSIIAAAVHGGYRAAIELDDDPAHPADYGRREHPRADG